MNTQTLTRIGITLAGVVIVACAVLAVLMLNSKNAPHAAPQSLEVAQSETPMSNEASATLNTTPPEVETDAELELAESRIWTLIFDENGFDTRTAQVAQRSGAAGWYKIDTQIISNSDAVDATDTAMEFEAYLWDREPTDESPYDSIIRALEKFGPDVSGPQVAELKRLNARERVPVRYPEVPKSDFFKYRDPGMPEQLAHATVAFRNVYPYVDKTTPTFYCVGTEMPVESPPESYFDYQGWAYEGEGIADEVCMTKVGDGWQVVSVAGQSLDFAESIFYPKQG